MCPVCKRQKQLDRCKAYKQNNRGRVSDYNREWKSNNKEHVSEYNQQYNIENREAIQKRQTKQHRERRHTDPQYNWACKLTSSLKNSLRDENSKALLKITKMPLRMFKCWLSKNFQPGMTWENHGSVWHMDHVVPISWFDLTDRKQRKICYHWSNTRPYPALKNQSRQATCKLSELLCQEIHVYRFRKNTDFTPLLTKFLEKSGNGSS